jgi:ABC-type uncharacterized transport system involved in gliding motility auxiliary subunit
VIPLLEVEGGFHPDLTGRENILLFGTLLGIPRQEILDAEARIAAFGDSDFVSNAALGVQGNKDLFLNALNWLAQQENLIAIRPRDPEDRRITLTADQQRRIFYLTVLIVPGLILLAGVQTWWRRR